MNDISSNSNFFDYASIRPHSQRISGSIGAPWSTLPPYFARMLWKYGKIPSNGKGDMKCVVLFKKDVVLFKKEASRESPLWRRASEASGGGRQEKLFRVAAHSRKML